MRLTSLSISREAVRSCNFTFEEAEMTTGRRSFAVGQSNYFPFLLQNQSHVIDGYLCRLFLQLKSHITTVCSSDPSWFTYKKTANIMGFYHICHLPKLIIAKLHSYLQFPLKRYCDDRYNRSRFTQIYQFLVDIRIHIYIRVGLSQ